tara:strand:- start:213917 stop:214771 length:855 start_codon:yes stop_codon:yes gene_type:complete
MSINEQSGDVSLVDMFVVILRAKRLFLGVFCFIVLLGIVYAIFHRPTYEFSRTLYLASYISNGKTEYVDNATAVAGRIKNISIPSFVAHYNAAHTSNRVSVDELDIKILANKSTAGLVYISTKGHDNKRSIFNAFNKYMLAEVNHTEKPLLRNVKESAEANLKSMQQEISRLDTLLNAASSISSSNSNETSGNEQLLRELYASSLNAGNGQNMLIVLQEKVQSYKSILSTLTQSHFVDDIISIKNNMINAQFILILSIILGLVLALFCVYLHCFWQQVQQRKSH